MFNRLNNQPNDNNEAFIKLISELLLKEGYGYGQENLLRNAPLQANELANIIYVLCNDELCAEVSLHGNIIKLLFQSGEKFTLKIEKTNLFNYFV